MVSKKETGSKLFINPADDPKCVTAVGEPCHIECGTTPAAEVADAIADADTADGVFGERFSPNLNVRHLLATNQIERLQLQRYMTSDEVSKRRHEYVDASFIHHKVTKDTVGYDGDAVAFVYFTPATARIPASDMCLAESGLAQLDWNSTDESRRSALRGSGGWEMQFGWIEQCGVHQFVPTYKQADQYKKIWPLITRMDGTLARALPRTLRNQLLLQRGTGFSLSATDTSTISSITCLKNAPSSLHLDGNNAEAGMVVMATAGDYVGGEFVLVEFGVEIAIPPGGILIAATHRYWHGNFKTVRGLRYSVLGYFREGLRGKTALPVKVNGPDLPFTKHAGGGSDE